MTDNQEPLQQPGVQWQEYATVEQMTDTGNTRPGYIEFYNPDKYNFVNNATLTGTVTFTDDLTVKCINALVDRIYQGNVKAGWWSDLDTGEPKARNDGELFMLIVTEIAEAMEGHRKNLQDDKLPHRKMTEVEMADAVIRIFDYCGGRGLDLGGAIMEKLAFNATREDHKIENRRGEFGKKI